MKRTKFKWVVRIAPKDNPDRIIDREVEAFWGPEHDLTKESVVDAARLSAWWETFRATGEKVLYVPLAEPVLVTG